MILLLLGAMSGWSLLLWSLFGLCLAAQQGDLGMPSAAAEGNALAGLGARERYTG